jgi:hypothetical protein
MSSGDDLNARLNELPREEDEGKVEGSLSLDTRLHEIQLQESVFLCRQRTTITMQR